MTIEERARGHRWHPEGLYRATDWAQLALAQSSSGITTCGSYSGGFQFGLCESVTSCLIHKVFFFVSISSISNQFLRTPHPPRACFIFFPSLSLSLSLSSLKSPRTLNRGIERPNQSAFNFPNPDYEALNK